MMPHSRSLKMAAEHILERVRRHQAMLLDLTPLATESTAAKRLLDLASRPAVPDTGDLLRVAG